MHVMLKRMAFGTVTYYIDLPAQVGWAVLGEGGGTGDLGGFNKCKSILF